MMNVIIEVITNYIFIIFAVVFFLILLIIDNILKMKKETRIRRIIYKSNLAIFVANAVNNLDNNTPMCLITSTMCTLLIIYNNIIKKKNESSINYTINIEESTTQKIKSQVNVRFYKNIGGDGK